MKLSSLALRLGGKLVGEDREFKGFITDSREDAVGQVFLAIRGERVDGHQYAESVLARGAAAILCEQPVMGTHILVPELVPALARFGNSIRCEFDGPVIGITGSNGKTGTKEFTVGALNSLGEILYSRGNKNTELTSPLIWRFLTPETRAVVVEMGMRGFGQIKDLAQIAEPTIGVITMIGTAHIEKVGDRKGIARAKGELLQGLRDGGVSVLPRDDLFFEFLAGLAPGKMITFGAAPDSDIRLVGYRSEGWAGSAVRGSAFGEEFEMRITGLGRHQAMNALAAMGAAVAAGVSVSAAAAGIASVQSLPMRMEVRDWEGKTVLVDTYNASPDSMQAALATLETGPVVGRRVAILGAMRELGDFEEDGHRAVGKMLAESRLDLVYLTGGSTKFIRDEALRAGFPSEKLVGTDELNLADVRRFLESLESGDVVLLKASRALGLEGALE